ncbi:aspartate kinase [Fulvivirga sedimenti]|uniref:Aspartokinase n=1 Tax=Fulvivirga sedimenti TaxID=2879465 RepID=A0A9X1HX27_9BACT|nr:aspartate kinase [Fulvivirga sedimenti]MCA6078007.1 aspartate kinase [Fulvivirga sedimenti]
MRVFKFGGASVSNEKAIRNMASILRKFQNIPLLVVVSAMGKTTNHLEKILGLSADKDGCKREIELLKKYHLETAKGLFSEISNELQLSLDKIFNEIENDTTLDLPYPELYDRIISQGEILSSTIIASYLQEEGLPVQWLDAREYVITDAHFREGHVDWSVTCGRINKLKETLNATILLTQGFIGRSTDQRVTTLGREGSDYTAAIFASCLNAESVTVWKDVEGIMNGDPKKIEGTQRYKELPYREAAEMTYYGASVIHPKTIKPLANKGIPLMVKSFYEPDAPGTVIHECQAENLIPAVIIKENQCLISFHVRDFTFINERNLTKIFHEISEADLKINLMQNSAISFSICVDFHTGHLDEIMSRLQSDFSIRYNTGLELITIKNYTQEYIDRFRSGKHMLLEQISRNNYRAVIKPDQPSNE